MSRGIPTPAKTIVVFALVLLLALGWSTVADAQTPADVQYGSPTATSSEYSGASFTNETVSDDSADSSGTSSSGTSSSGTSASGSEDVGNSEVLPTTGGPSLLLLAGSVALVASGLLVLRRAAGR